MEKEAEKEAELDGSDYARGRVTMVDISKYFLDYHKKKREKEEEEEEEMDAEKMMEEEDSNNMDTTETGTCTTMYMYIYLHLHAHIIQCNSNSLSLLPPLLSSIFFPFLSHHYLLLLLTRVTESPTSGSPVLYRRITVINSLPLYPQPSSSTLPTRMCLSLSLGIKGERK